MNYIERFLLATVEACEPLRRLIPSKCKQMWNNTYQSSMAEQSHFIKKYAKMAIYDKKE